MFAATVKPVITFMNVSVPFKNPVSDGVSDAVSAILPVRVAA